MADVTLRELASHTSGLPDFTAKAAGSQNTWFGLLHADGLRQDAAETVADTLQQGTEGRGSYSYSTAGIALLAHLLAAKAATTYGELLTERILEPFALTDTLLPATVADLPEGWTKGRLGGRPAEPWVLGGLGPGGGMWSTCQDLASWLRLTRDGRQPGSAGLDPVAPAPILPWMPEAQMSITWVRASAAGGEELIRGRGHLAANGRAKPAACVGPAERSRASATRARSPEAPAARESTESLWGRLVEVTNILPASDAKSGEWLRQILDLCGNRDVNRGP